MIYVAPGLSGLAPFGGFNLSEVNSGGRICMKVSEVGKERFRAGITSRTFTWVKILILPLTLHELLLLFMSWVSISKMAEFVSELCCKHKHGQECLWSYQSHRSSFGPKELLGQILLAAWSWRWCVFPWWGQALQGEGRMSAVCTIVTRLLPLPSFPSQIYC